MTDTAPPERIFIVVDGPWFPCTLCENPGKQTTAYDHEFTDCVEYILSSACQRRLDLQWEAAKAVEAERDALSQRIKELEHQLLESRETNARLNRRCQLAESAAAVTVEECRRKGVSLGRGLANWAASDADRKIKALEAELATLRQQCWCHECNPPTVKGNFPLPQFRMILCPDCGNKRCPRATSHRHACTGSNDPGQPGSVYGNPTPQETEE